MDATQSATGTALPTEGTSTEGVPQTPPALVTEQTESPAQKQEQIRLQSILQERRKNQAIARQARADREAATKERQEALQYKQLFEKGRQNPVEALKAMGWSYADITNYMLNEGKEDPMRSVKQLEQTMQEERAQRQKEAEEREQAEMKKAQAEAAEYVDLFKEKISDYVAENPDTCELITIHDGHELVFEAVQEHYNRTGKVLPIKLAAEWTEKYIEDLTEKSVQGKRLGKRYRRIEAEAAGNDNPEDGGVMVQREASSRTLNNNLTSNMSSVLPAKTESERMRRALSKLG